MNDDDIDAVVLEREVLSLLIRRFRLHIDIGAHGFPGYWPRRHAIGLYRRAINGDDACIAAVSALTAGLVGSVVGFGDEGKKWYKLFRLRSQWQ